MTSNTKHDTIPGSVLNDKWLFLKPIGWPRLKKRIDKLHERVTRVVANSESEQLRSIAKIKSQEITSTHNSRNLPSKTTITKEYVRCGKLDCPSKHGPYYYAYWKENGKLRKKYIGKYHPPVENASKAKSSDMDHTSSDTVTDPSNSTEDV